MASDPELVAEFSALMRPLSAVARDYKPSAVFSALMRQPSAMASDPKPSAAFSALKRPPAAMASEPELPEDIIALLVRLSAMTASDDEPSDELSPACSALAGSTAATVKRLAARSPAFPGMLMRARDLKASFEPAAWMVLDRFVRRRDDGSFPADCPTAASLTNSRGDPFDVCLQISAPPQPSTLFLRWPAGPTEGEPLQPVGAHGGALLLLMHYSIPVRNGFAFPMIDYIVYEAKSRASTKPSLRRLPPLGGTIDEVQARVNAEGIRTSKLLLRRMDSLDIGIIQLGLGVFAVAELHMDTTGSKAQPELRVFTSDSEQWVLKQPSIVPAHQRDDLDMDHILWYWECDAVVPFQNLLCWVDYSAGVMLSNVLSSDPEILFLELPARQHCLNHDQVGRECMEAYHMLGTTNAGTTLKFAFVLWHDGIGQERYEPHPYHFSITTWTLREKDGMAWEQDNVVTADELWALDEFSHLPRELPLYPSFSADDPNAISFVLKREPREQEDGTYDVGQIWLVAIDMMKKTLKSSILYTNDKDDELSERKMRYLEPFLPVDFTR
ncbi:hypothetical protein ACP70R_032615 [Stipagrostis hirtigluma subsp. patula]